MNDIHPAEYWRASQEWSKYLGKTGTVLASTVIRVASPELASSTPYSYVLVDLGTEKKELMGVGNDVFEPGATVRCVLRKLAKPSSTGIIRYGLKVELWHE